MEKEKEFDKVVKILEQVYACEIYWYDPELINETIKALKVVNKTCNKCRAFTENDMENAFNAGADKRNWTKIKLTGVISGNQFTLEPRFDKWFEHYQ